jgi:predicted Zn-dependent peptidase
MSVSYSWARETSQNIRLDIKEFFLENGMQFLVVERPSLPQVACRVAVRAGSALEEKGRTGIAHLLEHMMFKGTKNFGTLDIEKDEAFQKSIEEAYQAILQEENKRQPDLAVIEAKKAEMDRLRSEVQRIYVAQAFSSQLGKNGAVHVNAFTSKDQTQYMASVPSDMLEQWFSIMSEQLFEPSWREFYVEKEVVQREWAFRYVNNPEGAAWLDLNATLFTAHPYRNPTIGWRSDMDRFSTKAAMEFHRRYYNPSNVVCVLVGDITLEHAKILGKTYFSRYPAGMRAPERVTGDPPQEGPRRSIRSLGGARTPLVRIGFPAASMGTDDFYALDALTMVLSYGRGARLTQSIVNKGLAVEAWAYNPDNRYGGMVILGGSPLDPIEIGQKGFSGEGRYQAYVRACEGLESILWGKLEELKTELVSHRELARIKKLNQRDFIERMRNNESLAGTLATLEVLAGWRYLLSYLEEINEVTPEMIKKVAQKYFKKKKMTAIYVIPGEESDRRPEPYQEVRSVTGAAARSAVIPVAFENHSDYPTPEDWKHPLSFTRKPEKIIYPKAEQTALSGATVFYLPDRELPLVDLSILVKAGDVDIPNEKMGLPGILNGAIIRGGTKNLGPSELALVLDENAIKMSIAIGEEESVIKLSVMREEWDQGLSLLADVLTQPAFDQEVLKAVKKQSLSAIQRQGGDARSVLRREARIGYFEGHPYGRDPLMALDTIPTITADDLRHFLKTYFVPSNMVVAISGDISKADAFSGLEGFLERLPAERPPDRELRKPDEPKPFVAIIHKPGQVQSQISIMLPSVERTHPEYWKIGLLMDIFGGTDSLVYTRLRDDLGLVYAAGFYQTYKWRAGMLMGYIGCRGDMTTIAIGEALKIMNSLHEGIPEKELEQKRQDVLNSFVFNVDTPDQLVEVYGRYALRSEPLDTLERIQNAYLSATSEELKGLANRYLKPSKTQIIVVGDKTARAKTAEGDPVMVTLEEALRRLSDELNLPFREIPLR